MVENSGSNRLNLKITPNANRNEIAGFSGGILQVKIAAPPVKGKANNELISFLSRALGVKRSAIYIVKGQTSRSKVIIIENLSRQEIIERLFK